MKPVTKKETALVDSEIFDHDEANVREPMIFLLYGKPGAGKTTAAQSASQYWPDEFPAKKPVMLRDTMQISWDPAGRVGVRAGNVRCAYNVNAVSLMAQRRKSASDNAVEQKDILDIMSRVTDEVQRIVAIDDNVTMVIDDTITFLNAYLNAHWSHPDRIPLNRDQDEDTQAMFGKILRWHTIYLTSRLLLPADVVSWFLFHGKSLQESVEIKNKKERKHQQMVRMTNDVTALPSITGGALDLYTGAASVEFAMIPTQPPVGSKAKSERRCYTEPHEGYRAKNRLPEGILSTYELPPLKNTIAKIAKACGWV